MKALIKAYTLSECMDVMAEYAEAYECSGGKNIIFCEDRLTLIAERALIGRMGGTFDTSVSTFARFLRTDEKALSKQGSVMAVGEVMARLQREKALQCFTTLTGVSNNALCIYETLAQMAASKVTPEMLRASLALLPEDNLKRKVSDLTLIYEGYTAFLNENGFLDESKYLTLLPERIRAEGCLRGYNVFFLCYNSFTAQAREVIRAALETADNVLGIFCAGEEALYTNGAVNAFKTACEGFGKLEVRNLGVQLDGEAEALRKGLFNPIRAKAKQKTDKIALYEARNKTEEAEFVAAKIRREMTENPSARYRDFAVLVPSVEEYALPLKKVLSEYNIPYFIDEKKSLKRHPLARFLLDCFRVVREGYSPLAVQSLTQNFFFGESDEYRNYLLKFANYRGGAKRAIKGGDAVKGYNLNHLEKCRERLLLATKNIKARGHGRDYCAAVRQILSDFNAEKGIEKLSSLLDDISQKGYLAQILRALDSLLDEAEMLTANKELSVAEFEAILSDGLDATEISLIPLKSDAVFVGSISESRIEKVRVTFAMGMTDAVPASGADTAIISDKEIARLEEVQATLEPTVAEVNLRGRESVCLNLCAFTDKLFLSYPLAADGSEPAVSEIFRDVDALFIGMDGRKLPRSNKVEDGDFIYRCASPAPAVRQLLIEYEDYRAGKVSTRRKYASLYTALDKLGVQEGKDYLQEDRGQVCVERGEELFFKDGKISPTALEAYFACPFRHFADNGLRLHEREETAVMAVDTGNFIHDLLQKSTEKIAEMPDEKAMRAFAEQLGKELLQKSVYAMQQETKSGEYFLAKLLKEGVDVVAAAYQQVKNSKFVIEKMESAVQSDVFYGKVDRMDGTDTYVRVIDYKTGKIDDSATAYYTGQKIQMQLYMSELKGERVPAGVFYFPASVEYVEDVEGRFRMKGFMNGNADALLCGDVNLVGNKKSEYFPAALENAATVKRVMDEKTFRDFLDYSVLVARQGVAELKDGFIAPTPYSGNCEYCKYGGMCGFRKDVPTTRKEKTVDPKAIAKVVQSARGEEEA